MHVSSIPERSSGSKRRGLGPVARNPYFHWAVPCLGASTKNHSSSGASRCTFLYWTRFHPTGRRSAMSPGQSGWVRVPRSSRCSLNRVRPGDIIPIHYKPQKFYNGDQPVHLATTKSRRGHAIFLNRRMIGHVDHRRFSGTR